jgi:hypothetical protein
MPVYSGPRGKSVKIKPMDKDLLFDGTNLPIEKFIRRYENAGSADGASSRDLAKQVLSFIKGLDLKDEVEEMTGHETADWELLKKQLLNRFGISVPLVKYSKEDLKKLVNQAIQSGGIKTLEEFKVFRSKYEVITNYLFTMGHISHLEESREYLLDSLSPDLETSVTKELISKNEMLASRDGGDILPSFDHLHPQRSSVSIFHGQKKPFQDGTYQGQLSSQLYQGYQKSQTSCSSCQNN